MPQHRPQPRPIGNLRLLDTSQLVELTGLSYCSVIRALKSGQIASIKLGGKWLAPADQFTAARKDNGSAA